MGYLSGWKYRIPITIDADDVGSNLTWFPILVYLSASSGKGNADLTPVFDEVGANRKKIAITSSDGTTQLYVEIEKWDESGEVAWLWVSKTGLVIDSSTDTILYIYFDNDKSDNVDFVGDVTSTPAKAVWNAEFLQVLHMDDNGDTVVYDSTTYAKHQAKYQGAGKPAKETDLIGYAQHFTGATSDVLRNMPNWVGDKGSIECMFKAEAISAERALFSYFNGWTEYVYCWIAASDSKLHFALASSGGSIGIISDATFTTGVPYYIAITQDGTSRMYVDGAVQTGTDSGEWFDEWGNIWTVFDIGWLYTYNLWDGEIDEFRVSSIGRSADWIAATKKTLNDAFVTYGNVELCKTDDLVLHLPVHEGSGTKLLDHSGLGNHGTILAGTPLWVEGRNTQKALTVDGTDDYVKGSFTPTNLNAGDFTISLWMKGFGTAYPRGIFSLFQTDNDNDENNYALCINREINSTHLSVFGYTSSGRTTLTSTATTGTGHIVVVKEGLVLKMYVDSKYVGTATLPSTMRTFDHWAIGKIFGAGNVIEDIDYFDDFRMWKRAFNPMEIKELYEEGKNYWTDDDILEHYIEFLLYNSPWNNQDDDGTEYGTPYVAGGKVPFIASFTIETLYIAYNHPKLKHLKDRMYSKVMELADFIISNQYTGNPADHHYGGIASMHEGSWYYSGDAGVCSIGLILAYRLSGKTKTQYLNAAILATRVFMKHMQEYPYSQLWWTQYYGGFASVVTGAGAWILNMDIGGLHALVGVDYVRQEDPSYNSTYQAIIDDAYPFLKGTVGNWDGTGGSGLMGLWGTFAYGTEVWERPYGAVMYDDVVALNLWALYYFEGWTSDVSTLYTWVNSIIENESFPNYNAKICWCGWLNVEVHEAGSNYYDSITAGILSEMRYYHDKESLEISHEAFTRWNPWKNKFRMWRQWGIDFYLETIGVRMSCSCGAYNPRVLLSYQGYFLP